MKRLIMFALVLVFMAAPTSGQWVQSDSIHSTWKTFFLDTLNGYVVGNGKVILHTTDGGRSVVQQQVPVNITSSWFQGVYFRNLQEGWVVGSSGYSNGSGIILRTTDGGITWQQQSNPIAYSSWGDVAQVGKELWVVGRSTSYDSDPYRALILKSTNNGQNWQLTSLPQFRVLIGLVVLDSLHVVIYGGKGTLALTTDDGVTWQSARLDTTLQIDKIGFASKLVGYATASKYSPEFGTYLYKTTDGGATWRVVYTRPDAAQMSALAVLGDTLYLGGYINDGTPALTKSTDGGVTWQVEVVTRYCPRDIKMFDAKHGYMVTDQGFYYYTTPPPPVNHAPGWLFSVPLKIVYSGVSYRWPYQVIDADGDPVFVSVNYSQSPSWVTVDTVRKEFVIAVPSGTTGYFRFTAVADDHKGGVTTLTSDSIKVDRVTKVEDREVPTEFRLEQNYPNPFNPQTNIEYRIAKTEVVSLKVFNLLGIEVANLVDGRKSPGTYQVTFNGNNLPSGVYLYRLTAGQFVQTKRMLLVK